MLRTRTRLREGPRQRFVVLSNRFEMQKVLFLLRAQTQSKSGGDRGETDISGFSKHDWKGRGESDVCSLPLRITGNPLRRMQASGDMFKVHEQDEEQERMSSVQNRYQSDQNLLLKYKVYDI